MNLLLRPRSAWQSSFNLSRCDHQTSDQSRYIRSRLRFREENRTIVNRLNVNSLDQDPPEAAEAGAVWHFARVRYSHFLPDQVYTFPAAFLSSSSACFDFFRHLYFVSFGLVGISHRVVGVSGGEALHSRTYGARAAESFADL